MSHTPIDRLAQPSITPAAELVERLSLLLAPHIWKMDEDGPVPDNLLRPVDLGGKVGYSGLLSAARQCAKTAIAALSTPTTEPQPASPSGLVKEARIGLVMALANWSKYRNEAANEFVYQANKVATSAEELVAALAAPATADDATPPEQDGSTSEGDGA